MRYLPVLTATVFSLLLVANQAAGAPEPTPNADLVQLTSRTGVDLSREWMPTALVEAINAIRAEGKSIEVLTVTDQHWLVFSDGTAYYSDRSYFAARGIVDAIESHLAAGRSIDEVALDASGNWLVIAEDNVTYSDRMWFFNVGLAQAIETRLHRYGHIDSVALDGWRRWVVATGSDVAGSGLSSEMQRVLQDCRIGKRQIHELALSSSGWAIAAANWFWISNQQVHQAFRAVRETERAPDHIVALDRGRWAYVSNGAFVPVTAADKFEHGDAKGTIWTWLEELKVPGATVA